VKLAATVAAICLAGSASAQEAWEFRSTLYLWFPGLSSTVDTVHGPVEADVSAKDALSDLQFGFMGTVAAQRGNWILWGDLVYTEIGTGKQIPGGVLFNDVDITQQLTAITSYALYDVSPSPEAIFAIGAGARYFNLAVDTTVSGGTVGTVDESLNENWTVPVLAAQFYAPLNDRWFLDGTADWGVTGDDSETWQVYGGLGYRFNERWSTQVGYRHMNFSRGAVEVDMGGLLAGVTIQF
jgi:hypothetical protein